LQDTPKITQSWFDNMSSGSTAFVHILRLDIENLLSGMFLVGLKQEGTVPARAQSKYMCNLTAVEKPDNVGYFKEELCAETAYNAIFKLPNFGLQTER
jgi:hypothetical protein